MGRRRVGLGTALFFPDLLADKLLRGEKNDAEENSNHVDPAACVPRPNLQAQVGQGESSEDSPLPCAARGAEPFKLALALRVLRRRAELSADGFSKRLIGTSS